MGMKTVLDDVTKQPLLQGAALELVVRTAWTCPPGLEMRFEPALERRATEPESDCIWTEPYVDPC